MPVLTKPSRSARTAVAYVTLGALIVVWTIIYWVYLNHHPEGHGDAAYYWVYGFFFTGLVLFMIGLALGRIGRAARHADVAPDPPRALSVDPSVPVVTSYAPSPGAPLQYTTPAQVPAAKPAAVAIPVPDQQPNLPPVD